MGLTEVTAGVGGGGRWNSREGKRFPVCVTGVGEGEVGAQGSTVATENWLDKSSVSSSSSGERRWRSWRVLVDLWEDDSSSSSEWVSKSGSGVRVLQRGGLSRGGLGGWEMVGIRRLY